MTRDQLRNGSNDNVNTNPSMLNYSPVPHLLCLSRISITVKQAQTFPYKSPFSRLTRLLVELIICLRTDRNGNTAVDDYMGLDMNSYVSIYGSMLWSIIRITLES